MPPRKVKPPAPTGTRNPPDGAPAPRRTLHHIPTRPNTPQVEEHFNLHDVSRSEDDYVASQSDGSTHAKSATWEEDDTHHINDPDDDIDSGPKGIADIRHYFDRTGKTSICKLCKQVFLCSQLFSFLN